MEKIAAAEGVHPPLEHYSSSSSSSATAAATGAEQQEDSGWTDYLEDYFSSEIRESSSFCSSIGSCSWDHNISAPNSAGKAIFDVPKELTFKKTRTQKIFEDDDSLKDTATSPSGRPSGNYCSNTEKAMYSAADLKKKGLCLFPLSMILSNHN